MNQPPTSSVSFRNVTSDRGVIVISSSRDSACRSLTRINTWFCSKAAIAFSYCLFQSISRLFFSLKPLSVSSVSVGWISPRKCSVCFALKSLTSWYTRLRINSRMVIVSVRNSSVSSPVIFPAMVSSRIVKVVADIRISF